MLKIKTRFTVLIVVFTLFSKIVYPQQAKNFVVEKVYHTESEIPTSGFENKSISVGYFDGLGRSVQSIQVGASTTGKDIIQPIVYDKYGRQNMSYLPFTKENNGAFVAEQVNEVKNFYLASNLSHPDGVVADEYPFADLIFEKSPLNRILEKGAPGYDWQIEKDGLDNSTGNGNTLQFKYETNGAMEVKLFKISLNNLIVDGYFEPASLNKLLSCDENKVWSAEYKNMRGQVVLKITDITNLKLQTYYVYDEYGLLRYVLPPKAVEDIGEGTDFSLEDEIITNLCYYYEYDARKRMKYKKLPGAEPVYMVYDKRDRLVLTQDGNLRNSSKWMFTKYDNFNRPVLSGMYENTTYTGQESMQDYLNTEYEIREKYETINGQYNSADFGYTNLSFPILGLNDEILTVNYYDNYGFDIGNTMQEYCKSVNSDDYPLNIINEEVKGQLTGTKVKVLNTGYYISSISLYDDKYRPVRAYSINSYLEKSDLLLTQYNFTGNVLKTLQIHQKSNNAADTIHITQRFEYDHALRLEREYHKVSTNPEVLLSQSIYNEIGQLLKKKMHESVSGNFLQEVDFEYNIWGWLTKINDPEYSTDDLFAMQLAYNNIISGVSDIADVQYNGNISAIVWGAIQNKQSIKIKDEIVSAEVVSNYNIVLSPTTTVLPGAHLYIDSNAELDVSEATNGKQAYVFQYDKINRLTNADYKVVESGWTDNGNYDLEMVNYDANGNISLLKRKDKDGAYLDDLIYDYMSNGNYSNQLRKVTDNGDIDKGFYDVLNTGILEEYIYDDNGNLVVDDNKGIDIHYNYLNLPKEIDFGEGNKIEYIYDATGIKLAKKTYHNNILSMEVEYAGNIIYEDMSGDDFTILTSEGKVTKTTAGYAYEYYLKDHLGNNRVMFHDDGSGNLIVDQVNDYYPFGMLFEKQNTDKNKYLYNGKELQEDVFNGISLDLYDYGARFYDAALGRWHSTDPLEQYDSPYIYVGNNPILINDPTGMWGEESNQSWDKTVVDPNGRIIFHDPNDPDKNIYRSTKYSSDGTDTEGMEVIGTENPHVSYRTGWYLTIMNAGDFDVHLTSPARGTMEECYIEQDIIEIVFTGGGLIAIKKGGKWLIKKFTKKVAKEIVEEAAEKGVKIIATSMADDVLERFIKHAFAKGRHADLGVSVDDIATNAYSLIKNNMSKLGAGDNTITAVINGIPKSFKAFVKDGKVISMNMYSGVSSRVTEGTLIELGKITW